MEQYSRIRKDVARAMLYCVGTSGNEKWGFRIGDYYELHASKDDAFFAAYNWLGILCREETTAGSLGILGATD